MLTTNMIIYSQMKHDFFNRNNHDYEIATTPMNEYGEYMKTYTFKNGKQWYENIRPHEEVVETETVVKGIHCTFKNTVSMTEIEFWSSDNSSMKYYELDYK